MTTPVPPSPEPTLDLKNRWLAGFLALLIPGLGHLYQGRLFKAAVYAVCVLGLFFSGQALGDWKVVYLADTAGAGRIAAGGDLARRLLQGYGAQFPVGVFAWPAVVQSRRYQDPRNDDGPRIAEPIDAPFRGGLWVESARGPRLLTEVSGRVRLTPAGGGATGAFEGEVADGRPLAFEFARVRDVGRRVSANEVRTVEAVPASLPAGFEVPPDAALPVLRGGIPRPFGDRYQVPLGDQGEDALTAKLGGRLEIAYVFTWIAGLLNVLAIWDALDGPAYGFGHEPELNEKRKKRRRKDEPEAELARRPEPVGRA